MTETMPDAVKSEPGAAGSKQEPSAPDVRTRAFNLDRWIAVAAFLISLASAYVSCRQDALTRRVAQQHLAPDVGALFDFPVKDNPVLVLVNRGDTPAASLSVTHDFFTYQKSKSQVLFRGSAGRAFDTPLVFVKEFGPKEHFSQSLSKVSPVNDRVHVYVFNLRWYRLTDMAPYEKRELFFVDDGIVVDHSAFRSRPYYEEVLRQLDAVALPRQALEPGMIKLIADALEKERKGREE